CARLGGIDLAGALLAGLALGAVIAAVMFLGVRWRRREESKGWTLPAPKPYQRYLGGIGVIGPVAVQASQGHWLTVVVLALVAIGVTAFGAWLVQRRRRTS
ncbi:MAG TPA: hypothetical protein VMY34_04250, partial [Acidimicrobiales bacterium]|nr:hypothetical protein [Acidimicrobiales bacterium]